MALYYHRDEMAAGDFATVLALLDAAYAPPPPPPRAPAPPPAGECGRQSHDLDGVRMWCAPRSLSRPRVHWDLGHALHEMAFEF